MQTIGQRLKDKRVSKKISIEEVHKATKIHPRVISALEEDRAEERLNKLYIKNFIYDYAKFLGMDAYETVAEYLNFNSSKPRFFASGIKKINLPVNFRTAVLTAIICMFLFTVLFLIFRQTNTAGNANKGGQIQLSKTTSLNASEKGFSGISRAKELNLTLTSKKKVWLQIKSDGKVVFQDILKKGDAKNIKASDSIELWAGDASALELELDGKALGSPGSGVIKNVIITRDGMEIGGNEYHE
ncbi:MAG: RodZ domain-containing protein [Candidatus Omnitrophota bacterium]